MNNLIKYMHNFYKPNLLLMQNALTLYKIEMCKQTHQT